MYRSRQAISINSPKRQYASFFACVRRTAMCQLFEDFHGKRPPSSARALMLRWIWLLILSVSAIWLDAHVGADLIALTSSNLPPFEGVNLTQGSHPVVGVV